MGLNWTFQNEDVLELPEGCVGFVYEIVNKVTGKRYIGKKLAKFSKTSYKTVTLKDGTKKKKKIKAKTSSDWLTYYGSSNDLKADVKSLGKEYFSREILRYCYTKGETSYYEAKFQFETDCILTDKYYNEFIMCRISSSHVPQLKKDNDAGSNKENNAR